MSHAHAGNRTADRFAVTFIAPNQQMTSGGAYAIEQLALHCAPLMEVSVVVEEGDPRPLPGVAVYPSETIGTAALPPADALVIAADDRQGEQLFGLPREAGVPILFFQGYGTPENPTSVANLTRAKGVITVATWLVDEAARFGCAAELVRYGLDRSIFFPGPPTSERRPSVMMMTSHIDWKGTWDGLAAINLAAHEIPEIEVQLFGHLDPGIPQVSFLATPDRPVIAHMMRRSMVFVCSSWEEGFGLPGVEAMLCGAALATTDTKGSRDYAIPEETALVSEPHAPEALAENIVRLVGDTQLRRRCVAQAGRLVDQSYTDWPTAAVEFGAALRKLAASLRGTPEGRAVSYHRSPMDSDTEHAPSPATSTEKPTAASRNGSYDFDIDLDSESTHAKVVRLVGEDKRVLELGPATGYMSRVLSDRRCSVVGIEIDPDMAGQASQYCERMIVGDLEALDLPAELGSDRFDVIVAADVLEHLKNPLEALRRLRPFLAENGFFVISLPNVAHGSVRLALLEGRFPYQRHGLLDETHLRFFTRESIETLLDEAELATAEIYHQNLNLDASEVPFDRSALPAEMIESLEQDPDAQAYQFVIKAIPLEAHGLREVQRRMRSLAEENAGQAQEISRLSEENGRLREDRSELRSLQEALAAISSREGQLRSSLIDAHEQLLQRDEQLNQLREELVPLREMFDRLRATPFGRAYLKLRRARRLASAISRRAGRYRAALRKL